MPTIGDNSQELSTASTARGLPRGSRFQPWIIITGAWRRSAAHAIGSGNRRRCGGALSAQADPVVARKRRATTGLWCSLALPGASSGGN